jgi:phosphoglycolate phosphatase
VLSIIGLSLPQAMERLAPESDAATRLALVDGYKDHYAAMRASGQMQAVLYPGALEALHALHAVPDVLLAIATGKSRRGLDAVLAGQGIAHLFVSTQVADDHPSKPHPSMTLTALAESGVAAQNAVMIGDTTHDMTMARSADVPFVGVDWGYHAAEHLDQALTVLSDFSALEGTLKAHWGVKA